jgi:branched-chain amino acid transport system permease protein
MKKKNYQKSSYLKTSIISDMAMIAFDTPFRRIWAVVGLLIIAVFPFLATPFFMHIANLIAIASIGAMALNLLSGNAGLLSLGQAGFLASGAFTTAIMTVNFSMPFWVTIPAAGVVGAILGFIAGLPSLRLKGIYLGLSTLAMHYVITYACSEYQFWSGSNFGIVIKPPSIGPLVLADDRVWHYFLWIFVGIVGIFITNLLRTRPGRAWTAIRNRDIAAEVMGINIGYYKVLAFVVSTAIIGMAGSIYVYYTKVASIEEYSFILTISYLAMIISGGMRSVLGSLMGAFLITSLPYSLIYLFGLFEVSGVLKDYFFSLQSALFGLVIIVFLLVEPLGLAEIWRRVRVYFELWPFRYKPLSVTKR